MQAVGERQYLIDVLDRMQLHRRSCRALGLEDVSCFVKKTDSNRLENGKQQNLKQEEEDENGKKVKK